MSKKFTQIQDIETGLYYCNARYYDPKIYQWIQPVNSLSLNLSNIDGLKSYAYANNKSINIHHNISLASTKFFEGAIGGSQGLSSPSRNLSHVPRWLETLSTGLDHGFTMINPIRSAIACLQFTDLWDLMRLDGVTDLPGTLSKVTTGIGWGLSIAGGLIAGHEKYASGASLSSSIAGGLINAGISSWHACFNSYFYSCYRSFSRFFISYTRWCNYCRRSYDYCCCRYYNQALVYQSRNWWKYVRRPFKRFCRLVNFLGLNKVKGDIKMEFKRNVTSTLACVITECLISLIPMICMIYLFFMMDKIDEIFSTLLIVLYFILITNVILIIISFIAQIFIKTKYYINDECLVVKTKTTTTEIKYSVINVITYDFGDLTKFNTKSSQLVLFDKDYKQLLSVNNPSIIMVHLIRKKCRHAKISYYHNKRFLYLLLLINSIFLFISIVLKFFY